MTASYQLMQQLLPGEAQDATKLEMGRTYEQVRVRVRANQVRVRVRVRVWVRVSVSVSVGRPCWRWAGRTLILT